MVTCPLCLFGNPADAAACLRCGQHLPGARDLPPAPATLVDRVRPDAPETVERDVSRSAIRTPMPAPMVEPIVPPAREAPATMPPGSVLTKGLAGVGLDPGSSAVAAAVTVREPLGVPIERVTPAPGTHGGREPRGEVAVQPRLVVVRGERLNAAYLVLDGRNYIGRSADKPVDIDLDGQEPVERVWASRQHAAVTWDRGVLWIEDLNSLNGTFVNRIRIHPGQRQVLQTGDVIQVGTVQMKVVVG